MRAVQADTTPGESTTTREKRREENRREERDEGWKKMRLAVSDNRRPRKKLRFRRFQLSAISCRNLRPPWPRTLFVHGDRCRRRGTTAWNLSRVCVPTRSVLRRGSTRFRGRLLARWGPWLSGHSAIHVFLCFLYWCILSSFFLLLFFFSFLSFKIEAWIMYITYRYMYTLQCRHRRAAFLFSARRVENSEILTHSEININVQIIVLTVSWDNFWNNLNLQA